MRLFKTLLHNCLHDLRKNLKQLIAIIFIIGIAITLFTGLSANSIEFEKRVNAVYSKENGNLADIWVTLNVNFNEETVNDKENVKKFIGSDGSIESRTLVPSSLNDLPAYALIYVNRPTINKEYETNYDYTNDQLDKDFFFVDEELIKKYEKATESTFSLGDEIPVSFDVSTIGNIKGMLMDDYENIISSIKQSIYNNPNLSFQAKIKLVAFIEENKDVIKDDIEKIYERVFNEENIVLNMKVSGVMKHPENIQNGTFSTSNMIVSARTLLCSILDKVAENIEYNDLFSFIDDIQIPGGNEEIKNELKAQLEEIKKDFSVYMYVYVEQSKNEIMNDDNNEYVQMFENVYNQLIIQVGQGKDVSKVIEKIKNYYLTSYPDEDKVLGIMDASTYPSNAIIQNDIVQSRNLTYCFPIIFFVVAILVVLTTITQMMLKQRIQIGTMKALGITRGTILGYYLLYMNIVGFLGVLLGSIFGPILLPIVMNIKYDILYSLPALGYSFPIVSILACLLGVALCVSLITYLVIRNELSYVPAESMRGKSPSLKFKEKKGKDKVKNVSLMMALRNIRVHMSRSIMVIVGVMGCTGLLVAGFGIEDVINYGKDSDLSAYLDCDYVLTYSVGTERNSMIDKVLSIDGVSNCEEYSQLTSTVTFNNKNADIPIFYFSYKAENFKFDDDYEDGHWDLNSVALSQRKADELGVKVGDKIDFICGGVKYSDMKVDKIFYTFANNSLFVYQETLPELSKTSLNAWVNLKTDSKGNAIRDKEEIRKDLLALDGVSSLVSREDNAKRISSYMTSIKSMTNTIKFFAILLAVVVLINLAILNFEERSRDIATLRVLGFSRFEISRSLVYEVMILTIIGALLGLLLGYPLEYLVLSTNITPLISWIYIIYWYSFVIGFLLSVVTAFVVNIIISNRVNKVLMAESLKSVE
ncbi:MAG: FtsX-like permease family protein [Candidatus Onthovivens sp.]|nr:FtsX-like permease family protein [Candidatus Onthovivens sp.]